MKNLSKISALLVVPVVALAVAVLVAPATASAAEDDKKSTNQSQSKAKAEDAYKYTAQSGDSFTLMARKAVQDYSKSNKSNLSQAQILFAETTLTQKAGSPYLEVGQAVSLKKADVKSAVDQAKKLTDAQKAAWQQYVAGVDFDTSAVGVAR